MLSYILPLHLYVHTFNHKATEHNEDKAYLKRIHSSLKINMRKLFRFLSLTTLAR